MIWDDPDEHHFPSAIHMHGVFHKPSSYWGFPILWKPKYSLATCEVEQHLPRPPDFQGLTARPYPWGSEISGIDFSGVMGSSSRNRMDLMAILTNKLLCLTIKKRWSH